MFETNSSSTHTLTMGKSPKHKIDESYTNTIKLGLGEYGWGIERLTTWYEKADYLSIVAIKDERKKEMLEEALFKKFPNCKIKYETEYDKYEGGNVAIGYIDHQSSGEIWNDIGSINDLYDVIFGDSVINIDNDNH